MFFLSGIVLSAALLFGGGTHNGFYADVCLELLAIPLLAAALWPAFGAQDRGRKQARAALGVTITAALAVLIEIVPLPFAYWREAKGLLAGPLLPPFALGTFSTLSLDPETAWAAGASLIVPLAIFGATLQLNRHQCRTLSFLVLGIGAISLILGFLQVLQGEGSALRFYDFTNRSEAVGFFANRNHFAALLNTALVLASFWLFTLSSGAMSGGFSSSRPFLWLAAAASFLVANLSGLAMSRSRAGVVLAMAAMAGSLLMISRTGPPGGGPERRHALRTGRTALLVSLFAVLFAAQFALGGLLLRFEASPLDDLRLAFNETAFEALPKLLPFGTGLGSFPEVYAVLEKPEYAFAGFANRAHNDLAELLLETGLVGGVLLLAFLLWLLRRSRRVWARPLTGEDPEGVVLLRASSLILGLLLLHSLADYPLRTAALGAVFAFFAAVLASTPALPGPSHGTGAARPPARQRPARAESWEPPSGWPEGWRKS